MSLSRRTALDSPRCLGAKKLVGLPFVCVGKLGVMYQRVDGRAFDELRPVKMEVGIAKYAEGSCRITMGDTVMLVTATVEDRVAGWMKGKGTGWVTAEYSMLPRSGRQRNQRDTMRPNGRS